MQLICAFVFAFVKSRFSHDVTHLNSSFYDTYFTFNTLAGQIMAVTHWVTIKILTYLMP